MSPRCLLVLAATAGLAGGRDSLRSAEAPAKARGARVTVLQVWASPQHEAKTPEELEEFVDQLRKISGKRSFRLEGKPVSRTLGRDATLEVDLPQGYRARLSIASKEGERPVLRQVLVNPKKLEAADLLKKSPGFTALGRIRRGDETFVLIVKFQAET